MDILDSRNEWTEKKLFNFQMQLTRTNKTYLCLSTKYLTLKDRHISTKTAKSVRTHNHIFLAHHQLHSLSSAGGGAGRLQHGQ